MARPPEFRTAQGIVPFGVGAIVDFADDTLMHAGLDAWPVQIADENIKRALQEACEVHDTRLAERLSREFKRKIAYFLSPSVAPEVGFFATTKPQPHRMAMPFVRFPSWHYCPRCRAMKYVPANTEPNADTLRCSNPNRLVVGKGEPCSAMSKWRRQPLIPVRFVVACEAGHIDDFPWEQWTHKGGSCSEGATELYFTSTPEPGLAGIWIRCRTCSKARSLVGAFNRSTLADSMPEGCTGARPWLGRDAHEPACMAEPQAVQRGASNVYFAKVAKSILIPPHSARIQQTLAKPRVKKFLDSLMFVDGSWVHQHNINFVNDVAEEHGLEVETFAAAVEAHKSKTNSGNIPKPAIDETAYRREEYKAFLGPRPPAAERHDFDIRSRNLSEYDPDFDACFDAVTLVPKLRETRVLTGFSRLLPPGSETDALARLSRRNFDWLPGVAVRGEGIFLRFSRTALASWSARLEVQARIARLRERVDRLSDRDRGADREVSAEFILVHTTAHLLIRQMAFEAGYDASSMQERLYVSTEDDPMAGFLLYTASGDSEGTLGGLVRRGLPGRLEATLRAAIENAAICSSDPLCIESAGQGLNSLNGAACHACSLLPETSCEEANMFLDRAFVIGTPDAPQIGYFSDLVA